MALDGFVFGAKDCKIAPWLAPETWGSPIDVKAIQMVGAGIETVNAQLEGDDEILDVHAVATNGTASLRFGFFNLEVLEVLTGNVITDSPPNSKSMTFTGRRMPYFGLSARIEQTAGQGVLDIFIPKIKLMEGFSVSTEYGQYLIPEVQAQFVTDTDTYGMMRWMQRDVSPMPALTIPPASGS